MWTYGDSSCKVPEQPRCQRLQLSLHLHNFLCGCSDCHFSSDYSGRKLQTKFNAMKISISRVGFLIGSSGLQQPRSDAFRDVPNLARACCDRIGAGFCCITLEVLIVSTSRVLTDYSTRVILQIVFHKTNSIFVLSPCTGRSTKQKTDANVGCRNVQ